MAWCGECYPGYDLIDGKCVAQQVDPCNCPEGTGYDSDTMMCVEGSTTRCWECPTMMGCETITCESAGCPDFMETYTCQCNSDCRRYGNCCEDASTCDVVTDPCQCP